MDIPQKSLLPVNRFVVRYLLIICSIFGVLEISYGLFRYTAPMNDLWSYMAYGAVVVALVCIGGFVGAWNTCPRTLPANLAFRRGVSLGLALAAIWIANILFTHLQLTNAEKLTTGSLIVAITFLIVLVFIIGVSSYSAYQTQQVSTGIRIGIWSGLVTGMLTVIIFLMMLYTKMDFLVQLMNANEIRAFLQSGVRDRTAWFFWEELAGSCGYLVMDVVLGTVLGLVGGLVGKGLAPLWKSPDAQLERPSTHG